MMGGGLTQFVASGDGQHVVIFSAGPHHPPMMYAGTDGAMPYLVQGKIRDVMNSMKTCPSVTFYFMKNSFSDISRKRILPNMIRAGIAIIIFGKIHFLYQK